MKQEVVSEMQNRVTQENRPERRAQTAQLKGRMAMSAKQEKIAKKSKLITERQVQHDERIKELT